MSKVLSEPRSPLLLSGLRFLSSEKQWVMWSPTMRNTQSLAIFSASKVTTVEFDQISDPPTAHNCADYHVESL